MNRTENPISSGENSFQIIVGILL